MAARRSASSLQRRMGDGIPCPGWCRERGSRSRSRAVWSPSGGTFPRTSRVPTLVRGSRRSPVSRAIRRLHAGRGDRAVLCRARGRDRMRWRWPSSACDRQVDRHLRLQPARRRERLGPVPHHDRRARHVGQGVRHRGDPADGRSRVRELGLHRVSLFVFEFNERAIGPISGSGSWSRAGRGNRSGATAGGGTSWR